MSECGTPDEDSTLPDDQPVIRVAAMPANANYHGDIFGGWLMGQMDLAAGSVAARRCEGRAVTAAIEAVSFDHPVKIGDEVSIYAKVTGVGRTSMKIEVDAWRRDLAGDAAMRVTRATFTFVAIDPAGKPRPIQN